MTPCKACGGPKPDDAFRACPDCRAAWRAAKRRPEGHAATIERLKAALRAIEVINRDAEMMNASKGLAGGGAWRSVAGRMADRARAALKEATG